MSEKYCPKCGADVGGTYEAADYSCGINAGYYCDACDLGIPDDGYEPLEGDIQLFGTGPKIDVSKLGTPISQLSVKPGPKDDLGHPDHAGYAEWTRICKSWGFD